VVLVFGVLGDVGLRLGALAGLGVLGGRVVVLLGGFGARLATIGGGRAGQGVRHAVGAQRVAGVLAEVDLHRVDARLVPELVGLGAPGLIVGCGSHVAFLPWSSAVQQPTTTGHTPRVAPYGREPPIGP